MAGQAYNPSASESAPRSLEAAHAHVRADPGLQFRFEEARQPDPPPEWLRGLGDFLNALGPFFRIVFWGGVALLALFVLYALVTEIMKRAPGRFRFWERKKKAAPEAPKFKPTAARARTLLDEADRLASEGRYGEAARVLLHRSIEDIEQAFPVYISPAHTSREIARLEPLTDQGRRVFSGIAEAVETSLFGERPLDASRYGECRAAYANFAFGAPSGKRR